MACALLNASCVLRDLFLVFLIGDGEQTLEARPSQFFHPAMSQVRLSGSVGVGETVAGRHGEEDEGEDCPRSKRVARAGQ
ncbi:hypothetical protein K438DRAFT_1876365 [Mycena galopus ATCC 62051]|nr:hypothetical protein K438DRAFT_1876365 [Mycena galopus ATCC 62051]